MRIRLSAYERLPLGARVGVALVAVSLLVWLVLILVFTLGPGRPESVDDSVTRSSSIAGVRPSHLPVRDANGVNGRRSAGPLSDPERLPVLAIRPGSGRCRG